MLTERGNQNKKVTKKIMFDSGKRFLKVSISLIPFDENSLNEHEKKPEHDLVNQVLVQKCHNFLIN